MLELNKIYYQDCLEGMELIDDKSIDMVLTSPPYDNLKNYGINHKWNFDIFSKIANSLFRILKCGGVIVWIVGDQTVNGSETLTSFKHALYFQELGLNIWDTMIYEKSGMSYPGSSKRYYNTFEYMFVLSKGEPQTANLIKDRPNKYVGIMGGNKRGGLCKRDEFGRRFNIWRYNNGKYNSSKDINAFKHPAIFPEQLALDHIKSWSNEQEIILDCFIGSGTTAIACKKLNRNFIGFENNEEYYKIAVERIK